VPVTEAALRVVLTNGTRLEFPGWDPEVLRPVMESVLRQSGSTCGVSGHPKTGRAGAPHNLPGDCQPWMISDLERCQFTADICPQATPPQIPSEPDGSIPNRDAS
jgi:hypothetical protein